MHRQSPLAAGRLTRNWTAESSLRAQTDQIAVGKYDATAATDRQIVARVAALAEEHGVMRSQIALAWLLQKAPVAAPIIGATKQARRLKPASGRRNRLKPVGAMRRSISSRSSRRR